ncbi:TIGR03862 family flavoprotein [Massilia antarctica]|uniref:TIGR03862 family flavoprotein n=1 Tax=Massilia antarctica TaxID=2765360 RepID=UPI0006BB6F7A|nr:TIGR03862 family flavoprotein [Massilia sp. H27-R4]MCY0914580.1 TIGR03862 family flavoprotein [Massilia sp. H27-R4]CUI03028.1 NAD(FAD)-utilizing dehydrogenases [Janthinobacterium sp. CG23_2]CUU26814.1 NAD(FAD)-utilizing dehydrogenases [Janthinobacterium sp. CG23_2]
MPAENLPQVRVAVIGGGPAGLMAAEVLSQGGVAVDLYDAMPSVGRKFLLAGKGGMNITHSEPSAEFIQRYGARAAQVAPWLEHFDAPAVRAWIHGLGVETFVGTSGRVFPTDMKAAPLLRAWLHRLREAGVQLHMRHRWLGWNGAALRFATPDGEREAGADAVLLALGGGSWARLGSDGAWVPLLQERAVAVAPLVPSNCGFDTDWSAHFSSRHAGAPLTTVAVTATDAQGRLHKRQGQFVITASGVEGSLIYALSADLREQIGASGSATIWLDLVPDFSAERVLEDATRPRGSRSMASHLQSRLGIKGVKSGLLRECLSAEEFADPARLAAALKMLPLTLKRARPIDEAISSAGGVRFDALDEHAMLRALPGVFAAGEMLDWEAPTGGYLLTACFASGRAAGHGALAWLAQRASTRT